MKIPAMFAVAPCVVVLGVSWHCLPAGPVDGLPVPIEANRIRADVKYLSSDMLQGRGVGSRGEEIAVDFIAGQFEKVGLKPGGERGTYFQTVPLVKVTTEPIRDAPGHQGWRDRLRSSLRTNLSARP